MAPTSRRAPQETTIFILVSILESHSIIHFDRGILQEKRRGTFETTAEYITTNVIHIQIVQPVSYMTSKKQMTALKFVSVE